MKIKRLKKIRINSHDFNVEWDKKVGGGYFSYRDRKICIGTADNNNSRIFEIICHEVMEICALEMFVRFDRTDCDSDFMFVYDHRQHTTMMGMFSAAISQFVV